jgi:hypothetical protein
MNARSEITAVVNPHGQLSSFFYKCGRSAPSPIPVQPDAIIPRRGESLGRDCIGCHRSEQTRRTIW